ncbi:hypothetical protein IM45_399 [Candidatus Palibaumannia cicadellinicola]|uniref:Uncharacterized protein n=1 Tax=Candidatus Palibaumannia cicadellinicola TaxID=186490 RepID=A0A088MXI5_9GAMM|nr:hypothetical protein IM45_399 [Candidatus Baumannia cicadellinicola]
MRRTGEINLSSTQVVIGDIIEELMLLYGIVDLTLIDDSLVS